MDFFKKHILKITLGLAIIFLAILSVYSIVNYNSTSNKSTINSSQVRNNNFNGNGRPNGQISDNQSSNGQKPAPPVSANPEQQGNTNNGSGRQQNGFNSNSRGMNRMNTGSNNSSSSYSPAFIAYCVVFFTLFISIFLLLFYKKIKLSHEDGLYILIGLLISGFLFRIFSALLIDGHPFDINVYKSWAENAANNLFGIYTNDTSVNYPPVYIYVLFIVGKLSAVSALSKFTVLWLKLPSIIIDILSGYFLYKVAKNHLSSELSLLLSAFYIFNPAVLINSTIWGQVDSFLALLIIVAIYFLAENKIVLSALFFTVSVLMKPQGIIFLPLLLFAIIIKKDIRKIFQCFLAAIITTLIVILPFSIYEGGFKWIFNLYTSNVSAYPYAAINAFNFFGLINANGVKDATTLFLFSYHTLGMAAIVLITLFSGYIFIKGNSKASILMASLLLITGVFNFSVGMHERYMFPALAIALLAYIYIKDWRLLILSAIFSLTIYINTHVALFEQIKGISTVVYSPVVVITSLLNLLGFIYLLVLTCKMFITKSSKINQ